MMIKIAKKLGGTLLFAKIVGPSEDLVRRYKTHTQEINKLAYDSSVPSNYNITIRNPTPIQKINNIKFLPTSSLVKAPRNDGNIAK